RSRDVAVDELVRPHVVTERAGPRGPRDRAEVEERLPADEAARLASAAAQVARVGFALGRGVEDHPEERVAVVAGEVRAVRRPDHRVAEAVRGPLELDGDL